MCIEDPRVLSWRELYALYCRTVDRLVEATAKLSECAVELQCLRRELAYQERIRNATSERESEGD